MTIIVVILTDLRLKKRFLVAKHFLSFVKTSVFSLLHNSPLFVRFVHFPQNSSEFFVINFPYFMLIFTFFYVKIYLHEYVQARAYFVCAYYFDFSTVLVTIFARFNKDDLRFTEGGFLEKSLRMVI